MINHVRGTTDKLTDFNVGSVGRTLLEAPAVEIDELYQQMFYGLKESIPTALYKTFQFDRLPSAAAYGVIRFTAAQVPASAPIEIPKGTVVRVPDGDIGYATAEKASIAVGATFVDVRAVADATGTAGNTLANTITKIDASINSVSAANPDAVVSGRNLETDDERAQRFQEFIQSLSRGPAASIEFGAKTAAILNADGEVTEYVAKARVIEPWLANPASTLGHALCYIYNGVNGASVALITETQKIVDGFVNADGVRVMGWKAAGVIVEVVAVTMQPIAVTVVLTPESQFVLKDIKQPVEDAIRDYVQNLDIGETLIFPELLHRIMRIPGVYDADMAQPKADVVPGESAKITVATVTIT